MKTFHRAATLALAASALAMLHCDSAPTDGETQETEDPQPDGSKPIDWKPGGDTSECNLDALLAPYAYGAKVKTLLTGQPLTAAELTALQEDSTQLKSMIEGWLAQPEAEPVLERFFMTAFQQTSGDNASLFNLLGRSATGTGFYNGPRSPNADEMLNASFAESFARTAMKLVQDGRPFSDVLTTDEFMMTTAQMSFLAFTDDEVVGDDEAHDVRTTAGHFDTITLVRDAAAAPPLSQALDPTDPKFGTFYHKALVDLPGSCNVAASQTIDTTHVTNGQWRLNGNVSPSFFVFSAVVLGRHQGVTRQGQSACNSGAANGTPLLDRGDFTDWHWVKVRKPTGDETPTIFYDIAKLRSATEMVLHTPRIGFLTSPGFFSTWATNEDNASRVTINQALIVALGKSFEGVAVTDFSPTNIDAEHAAPGSECYGCHQTLDPMRDYYRASFSNFYGQQLDPERTDLQADFVFRGVTTSGSGIEDLAQTLASHPDFPYAWAHKLCFYANSAKCVEGAELDRVVQAFKDSSLDFRVLVAELFSSPLVTGDKCVAGVDAGTTASIARRSTFCSELSTRTGVADICGIRTHFRDSTPLQNAVRDAVGSVPDDAFSRAVVDPVTISETSMFTRANAEAACEQAVLKGYAEIFGDATPDEATALLVQNLMGLPENDPRHDGALQILRDHVTEAVALGKTDQEAVQSAFVLACMSPSVAGVGF